MGEPTDSSLWSSSIKCKGQIEYNLDTSPHFGNIVGFLLDSYAKIRVDVVPK